MRASPALAFCPPDRLTPLSPMPVWSPDGSKDRSRSSAQSLITASYLIKIAAYKRDINGEREVRAP